MGKSGRKSAHARAPYENSSTHACPNGNGKNIRITSVNSTNQAIRITSVNSRNQASDVCRRTNSGSDNNNPHSNVNNNMTTSNVFDFKQYELDKMYSPQCKGEFLYCYNNARSIKRHSPKFQRNFDRKFPERLDTRNIH